MLQPRRWLLPCVVFVQALLAPAVVDAAGAHPLWRVSGGSGEAWLLGSLHFGRADMYPLAPAIRRAFEESDTLVVEANILEVDAAMLQNLATQGMYPQGETLEGHVSAETWRGLEQAAERFGLPVAAFQRQRPWLVAITLTTMELNRRGLSERLGIDRHFLREAGDGKRVLELESVSEQLGLFADLTGTEQEALLRSTLIELDKGGDYFDAVVSAWKSGDTERIDELVNASMRGIPGAEGLHRKLLVDRNQAMAGKIQDLVEGGGTHFVVVGAGHLVGDESIVEALREGGYTVTQQ